MQRYKKLLKCLLAVDISFILIIAMSGYRNEDKKQEIKAVSGNIPTAQTNGNQQYAIPSGKTVGIYVNTNGILVIDTVDVVNLHGEKESPAKNKLMPGDYILKLNGTAMKSKKQLIETITGCQGETLIFNVMRNGEQTQVKVNPIETEMNIYKIGIWVKDDLQGLGTITYIQSDEFGALGHSINDTDTGEMLDILHGELYEADIYGIEKGTAGSPGEIEGMISYQTENIVGHINGNRVYGIFGELSGDYLNSVKNEKAIPIASIEEVTEGKAYIQSYISGKKELYEIEIANIHKNDHNDKEMEIKVTDEKLIELTGGIVQGMSGSPIIQDGKLVGAVTHVFVDDPKRGYGIFIENMMESN